jgi:hypothetical protein
MIECHMKQQFTPHPFAFTDVRSRRDTRRILDDSRSLGVGLGQGEQKSQALADRLRAEWKGAPCSSAPANTRSGRGS